MSNNVWPLKNYIPDFDAMDAEEKEEAKFRVNCVSSNRAATLLALALEGIQPDPYIFSWHEAELYLKFRDVLRREGKIE